MAKRTKSLNRFTGDQDVSLSQYMLYRVRFALVGDLTDAWADFGGFVAHLDLIALVADISIKDHPWIAITYDRRIHRHIQKLAQKRAIATDYFAILSAMQPDIKAAAMRDFEYNAGLLRKEKKRSRRRRGSLTHTRLRKTRVRRGRSGRMTIGRPGRRRNGRSRRLRRPKQKRIRQRKSDETTG